MASIKLSIEELVHHATFLFGAQWRDALAAELGIPRKSLVLSLASGENISTDMTRTVVRLLEQRLEQMELEQAMLRDKISMLRDKAPARSGTSMQPRGQLQHAC